MKKEKQRKSELEILIKFTQSISKRKAKVQKKLFDRDFPIGIRCKIDDWYF